MIYILIIKIIFFKEKIIENNFKKISIILGLYFVGNSSS